MAIPSVADVTTSDETTNTTTHSHALPATVNAYDRLLYVAQVGHSSAAPSGGSLDGWSLIRDDTRHSFNRGLVYERRVADASEATALSGGTITITTSTGVKSSAAVVRVAGARAGGDGTAYAFSAAAWSSVQGTSADPPSLSPSWGSGENLWLAIVNHDSSANPGATSTPPTDFTEIADTGGVANQNFIVSVASRALETATQDPSAFTLSATSWYATTTFVYRSLVVSGTGAIALTGTAHGITSLSEGASGAMSLTGTAHGIAGLNESAAGAIALTGTAHGWLTRPASGAIRLTGTASGFYRDRKIRFVTSGEQAKLAGTWSVATPSQLRLFTADVDAALTEAQRNALTAASFNAVEASFTGYSAASLSVGNWTVTEGTPTDATHTTVTFTCSGAPASQVDVWGYYVTRTSDGLLIYYETFTTGPFPVVDSGDDVTFDPTFTIQ